jgi:hypothetical protein
MDDQVVPAHRVLELTGELLELPLEALVLERRHPAAEIADGVVMVLAARHDGLIPSGALAELDPLHEAELVEEIDRPVDARHPDVVPAAPQLIGDLLGGETAGLVAEEADHGLARPAGPATGFAQSVAS